MKNHISERYFLGHTWTNSEATLRCGRDDPDDPATSFAFAYISIFEGFYFVFWVHDLYNFPQKKN